MFGEIKPLPVDIELMAKLSAIPPSWSLIFNRLSNLLFPALFLLSLFYNPYKALAGNLIATVLWFASIPVKGYLRRERPYSYFKRQLRTSTKPWESFLSTHSLSAGFLFAYTSSFFPLAFLYLLIPLFRLVSFQHWPSDVLLGTFIGLIFGFLTKGLI